jgi:hypothetical protein
MSNDYALVSDQLGHPWQSYGFWNLGPVRIPPIPPAIGMTDRAGTGQIWYLFWDGESHAILSNALPPALTNVYTFGPWDGPYMGSLGWRLGVTTAHVTGQLVPTGQPHLQVDFPYTNGGSLGPGRGYSEGAKPVTLPDYTQPLLWVVPQPTNWPAPQPGTIPGIPSTSPVPSGGGLTAFYLAFATNVPVLLGSCEAVGTPGAAPTPHLDMGNPT